MYIIKKTYDATDANTNFIGRHTEYLEGKNGIFCICDTEPNYSIWTTEDAIKWLKSSDSAYMKKPTRSLNLAKQYAESEMKYGFYTIKVEIVEI